MENNNFEINLISFLRIYGIVINSSSELRIFRVLSAYMVKPLKSISMLQNGMRKADGERIRIKLKSTYYSLIAFSAKAGLSGINKRMAPGIM